MSKLLAATYAALGVLNLGTGLHLISRGEPFVLQALSAALCSYAFIYYYLQANKGN